ncbi:MAG TPA: BTAD domain-containing putative transcriptional regulator [Thermomonospora sp.]|nr:BTAD domain-containing putative transcriptional regulator [Thermomonospora sp.]
MRFGVLGPLAVWTDDGAPVRVPEAKVRALLAALLARRGRPVPADRLVAELWPARPPRNPAGTLQARVSQLRRTLEDAEPGARALLVSQSPGYALRVDAGALDADRFDALTARARTAADPRARVRLLTDALALWRGPAYADFADEDFLAPEIARLEEQRLLALEEQAEARLDLGEHGLLAGELADLVARHPLRERLRAAHLLALYRAGRQGEALAGYQELRERLAEELGVDPGPDLAALYQAMLRQDPALAPRARPRTNLPAPISDLIGRDEAIRETHALLESARLVTLTGPGGVGKTRLALAAAARLTGEHPDGVWFVELAPLGRGSLVEVTEAVAAILDVRDDTAQGPRPESLAERLAAALSGRRLLLVLDNCEHVVEPAAELTELLLKAAPGVRVLATSQEPLGLSGERVQAVPPLDAAGAVRLFAARAAAASPGFVLDDDTAPAVRTICTRLDGIPLALELAATRVRALGVHELAARLDDRFRLLAAGRRDDPAGQRTLRAAIDWSWEPLSEPERAVLRRLAVHSDGCTLQSAEAVCSGAGVDARDVLDLLSRLVDRSLVVVTADADGPRYRLLESVAAYSLERLHESGEYESAARRHVRYYTDLAVRAEPLLRGREQRHWLRRLDIECANLRAALERASASDALSLVNALAWYWYLRGRLGEARRSFALALSLDGPAPDDARARARCWQASMDLAAGMPPGEDDPCEAVRDPGDRARALWFATAVRWAYGDFAEHTARVDHAAAVLGGLGDRWGLAAALATGAKLALGRGDVPRLRRDAERGLALFRELGDGWGLIEATNALGRYAEITGDYDRATRLLTEGLRVAEDLGVWGQVSFALSGLGRVALLTGDLDRSRELHERAARVAAEHSDMPAREFAGVGLGLVARRRGDLDEAERHLRDWLPWLRQVNGDAGTSFILAELGFVAEQRGDAPAALALHTRSLAAAGGALSPETGAVEIADGADPRAVALALEGLAGAASLGEDHAGAARLLAMAADLRASVGAPLPPGERGDVDRIAARLRSASTV